MKAGRFFLAYQIINLCNETKMESVKKYARQNSAFVIYYFLAFIYISNKEREEFIWKLFRRRFAAQIPRRDGKWM